MRETEASMNEQPDDTEVIEDQPQADEPVAEEQQPQAQAEDQPADEPEEVTVQIGDEAPPAEEETRAPDWVRELRKQHRELQRQNRELQERIRSTEAPAAAAPQLGAKPTLEGHDYDAEKYEAALAAWFERKRQADDAQAAQRRASEDQQRAWQERLNRYQQGKAALKVRDFDEAEAIVEQTLNVTQQGVVVQGAENPELVIYALGKNPKKAKELAAISDPVKFAFAVAKLEAQLKVTNRKPSPPPPERVISGTGRVSGAVDSTLERLREEAARTGDMSKVVAYRRQKRA